MFNPIAVVNGVKAMPWTITPGSANCMYSRLDPEIARPNT